MGCHRAYPPTDQKVGGSNPSERAHVSAGQTARTAVSPDRCGGRLLTDLLTRVPDGCGEQFANLGCVVTDDVCIDPERDGGVRMTEPV